MTCVTQNRVRNRPSYALQARSWRGGISVLFHEGPEEEETNSILVISNDLHSQVSAYERFRRVSIGRLVPEAEAAWTDNTFLASSAMVSATFLGGQCDNTTLIFYLTGHLYHSSWLFAKPSRLT